MSDFNDRPFALGSLTGIRSFRTDHYGRLLASQLNVVWTPEENVGRCLKNLMGGTFSSLLQTMTFSIYADPRAGSIYPAAESPKPKMPADHRPGTLQCTCGFYAYFDNGPNSYHTNGNVLGLVEGYGVTTVGTRGFRAEKARIKALIVKPKQAGVLTDRIRANYGVPVFEKKREAFEAFPLTPPLGTTPATDPEFWTRDAL